MPSSTSARLAAFVLAAVGTFAGPAAVGAAPPTTAARPADDAAYIVTFRPGVDIGAAARAFRRGGIEVDRVYRHATSGVAATLDAADVSQLRSDPRVAIIERDGVVRTVDTQTSAPWGLDRLDQRTRPLDGTYNYGTTASGVAVYVVDTGIRATHVDFGGRVGAGFTAIADGRGTSDCNGHGTHVAGTSAGQRWGAAKRATLHPVRVLDCRGSGSVSGVIAGLDWIVAHHQAGVPAVANLSLGGGASTSLDRAIRRVVADGVTVVVAAGNSGTDACTSSPARVTEALTVAASTSTDSRASFSNWGRCVDLFAPGSSISSAYHSSDTAVAKMSGTSMAAPHVAGIAALHLAASPGSLPAAVHDAVNADATTGLVANASGSPNRLAHSLQAATEVRPPEVTAPEGASAPGAPAAPRATAGRQSLHVSWTAPADGGEPITTYTVRVHRARDGAVIRSVSVPTPASSTTVAHLRPRVSYYATVSATNAVGSSAYSLPSNAVTVVR